MGIGWVTLIPELVPIPIHVFSIPTPYPFFSIFHTHALYKWSEFGADFSNLGTTPILVYEW